jgi:hypothetical protein
MGRAASPLIGFLAISIGVVLYSVPPNTYSFARFILGQYFQDNQSRGHLDNREEALLAYVKSNAALNDPQSVLAAIDEFGSSNTWLMNVGNVKVSSSFELAVVVGIRQKIFPLERRSGHGRQCSVRML